MTGHSRIARQAGTTFLTAEEERVAWESGDKEKIITAHMHLAYRIATQFARAWRLDADELAGEAYLGLVRAAQKFDAKKGVRFHHYATFWCKALILKHIMDNWRMVKIGTTQVQRKLFFALHSTTAGLESHGEVPTAAILADVLGCTEEQIIEMQQRLGLPDLCLDAPAGQDGVATVGDFAFDKDQPSVEDQVVRQQFCEKIQALIKQFVLAENLTEREVDILYKRLYTDEPSTLQKIGDGDGVTRERVRQCEAKLVEKLSEFLQKTAPDLKEMYNV